MYCDSEYTVLMKVSLELVKLVQFKIGFMFLFSLYLTFNFCPAFPREFLFKQINLMGDKDKDFLSKEGAFAYYCEIFMKM